MVCRRAGKSARCAGGAENVALNQQYLIENNFFVIWISYFTPFFKIKARNFMIKRTKLTTILALSKMVVPNVSTIYNKIASKSTISSGIMVRHLIRKIY